MVTVRGFAWAMLMSAAAVLVVFTLFANAYQAHATLADDILCYINNTSGPPIPVFNVDDCPAEPFDVCPNLDGVQTTVPGGYHLDDENMCVLDDVPPAQCSNGQDDDGDGFTDAEDPNCHTDSDATNGDSYDPSGDEGGNLPACWDGLDNDGDGKTDWGVPQDENSDPGCDTPVDTDEGDAVPPPPPTEVENTLALCTDGIDNDSDELIDLLDPNCAPFMPLLTVIKIVSGGSASPSDFLIHVRFDDVEVSGSPQVGSSTGTTYEGLMPGSYSVGESGSPANYTGAFSGDCNASGIVTLVVGTTKTCTITNTFVPDTSENAACEDGSDNDGDGKIDAADPGCHSDGNASNSASYDAGRNDETDQTSSQPGGGSSPSATPPSSGGGGNGPIVGSYGLGGGPIVGQVLGVSTIATSCGEYLTDYLRIGRKNDPEQVKKLQALLNKHGANLPVTGFFGTMTETAVKNFQLKHNGEVLRPWVAYGLPNENTPTGYVYKTTKRWINLLECQSLNTPIPTLP